MNQDCLNTIGKQAEEMEGMQGKIGEMTNQNSKLKSLIQDHEKQVRQLGQNLKQEE